MQIRYHIRRKAVLIGLVLVTSVGLLTSGVLIAGGRSGARSGVLAAAQASAPTFHHCAVMGTLGANQAVHCSDIFTTVDLGVWVRNQVYCQRRTAPHALVACHGIIETLAYGAPGFTRSLGTGSCGAIANARPCPRARVIHEALIGRERPGSARRCTRWGESVRNIVEMPGSTRVFQSNVIATSHFTFPC